MKKIIVYSLLFITYLLFLASNSIVLGQEKIINYYTDIKVHKSGIINIKETIIYDFGINQKHGIIRNIPYIKTNSEGKKYKMTISDISVTDSQGNNYMFDDNYDGNYLVLKVGDPDKTISGIHPYIVRYNIAGALTYFSDHDELYWNVVGGEWKVPIDQSSSAVILPEEVLEKDIIADCYYGQYGSNNQKCLATTNNNKTDFNLDSRIRPGQSFTIIIGFPKNIVSVVEPQPIISFWETFIGKIIIILLILIGIIWYVITPIWIVFRWYLYGRDPNMGPSVTAYYDPPKNKQDRLLTPSETGGLIDETVDFRDFVATLIHLAKRGYFKIVEKKKNEFILVNNDKLPGKDKLQIFESRLIDGLFKEKKEAKLKDPSILTQYELFGADIYNQMVVDNFFPKNPASIRQKYYVLAGIAGVTFNFPLLMVALIFGKNMPAKTLFGVGQANKARGLINFLKSQDRHFEYLAKFDTDYQLGKQFIFEKFLPYAIAFGVEKQWAKKFADEILKQPDWYQSSQLSTFNSQTFANSIGRSFSTGFYTPTTTRSSSGFSSGFSSGGGFSGGGGGGGGGGSW